MNAESSAELAARARRYAALGEPARLAMVDMLCLGDVSPGEFAARLELPTNLVAHHVAVLIEAGLVGRVRSEGDRRRTYLRLRLAALSAMTSPAMLRATRVVFVCQANSARSQLAAALWRRHGRVPAASAGTDPAPAVHRRAVAVAAKHGLDLSGATTSDVRHVLRDGDLVVAVCDTAHEHLPAGAQIRLHWSVPDPARTATNQAFEAAFADIAARIDTLAPAVTPAT